MHYIVYKTKNLTNNKEYIGIHQTKDLNDGYLGSGIQLKRAIAKYGEENFQREILHECKTHEEMLAKEVELVTEEWCSWSNTYNICVGGFGGGFQYINSNGLTGKRQFQPEDWMKSAQKRRELMNTEWRGWFSSRVSEGLLKTENRGYTSSFLGKKHTEETVTRMRRSKQGHGIGVQNSQFGTMWITNGKESRKHKLLDPIPDGWYKGRRLKLEG